MNRKRRAGPLLRAWVSALAMLMCAPQGTAAAAEDGTPKRPEDIVTPPFLWQPPRFETMRRSFPKGLVAYVWPDRASAMVSVKVFAGTGFLHDPPDRPGLMEMTCASMISGGTSMWSPAHIQKQIDLQGMAISYEVHAAHTVFSADFPPSNVRKAINLLAEVVLSPTFDSSAIEAEKRRVAFRVALALDNSALSSVRGFERLAFGLAPVSPEKLAAAVQAVERKEIKDCHARAFGAVSIVLSVSGDFDAKALIDIIEYKFDTGGAPGRSPSPAADRAQEHGVHIMKSQDPWAGAAAGMRLRSASPADRAAADLLCAMAALSLERSFSPAATIEGRSTVAAGTVAFLSGTAVYMAVSGRHSEMPARLRAIRDAVSAVAAGNMETDAVDAARKSVESRVNGLFATQASSCDAFARAEALGLGGGYHAACLDALRALTLDEVRAAAKAFLGAPGPIYSIAGDVEKILDAEVEKDARLSDLGRVLTYGD